MNTISEKQVLASRNKRKRGNGTRDTESILRGRLSEAVEKSTGTDRSPSTPTTSVILASRYQPSLVRELPADWTQSAITSFFSQFVIPIGKPVRLAGFLDFLPKMYVSQPEESVVSTAVKAIALANLANRSSMRSFQVQATVAYGDTLRKLQCALHDPVEAKSDETLTTLLLIRCYEVSHALVYLLCQTNETQAVTGERSAGAEDVHGKAQATMLRLRGQDQFKTEQGRSLFRTVQRLLQSRDLMSWTQPSLAISEWPKDLYMNPNGERWARLFTKMRVAIVRLYELLDDIQMNDAWFADAAGAGRNALALEEEAGILCAWGSSPLRHNPIPGLSDSSSDYAMASTRTYPKNLFVFKNFIVPTGRALLHCARLRMLKAALDYTTAVSDLGIEPLPDLSAPKIRAKMLRNVDELCGIIPFLLGEIDEDGRLFVGGSGQALGAFASIYPLHLAAHIDGVPDAQFDWIVDQLQRIGTVHGIKQGEVMANYHRARRLNRD